jgi:hypothetical protein
MLGPQPAHVRFGSRSGKVLEAVLKELVGDANRLAGSAKTPVAHALGTTEWPAIGDWPESTVDQVP